MYLSAYTPVTVLVGSESSSVHTTSAQLEEAEQPGQKLCGQSESRPWAAAQVVKVDCTSMAAGNIITLNFPEKGNDTELLVGEVQLTLGKTGEWS